MAESEVDFHITVSREEFYTIITLMLHDACHDFDAGKTDKEFKKLFMKKDIAAKLARHRTQPMLGGAPEEERRKAFRKGINSDGIRADRRDTRRNVGRGNRDAVLSKRRQLDTTAASQDMTLDLGQQLGLDIEGTPQPQSPATRQYSQAVSPTSSPGWTTSPEQSMYSGNLQYAFNAVEKPAGQSAIADQLHRDAQITTNPEGPLYDYLIEHYNLENINFPSLENIKTLIDNAENYLKQSLRIPMSTTPLTTPPRNILLNMNNYDIFIDSLFKILSKMRVTGDFVGGIQATAELNGDKYILSDEIIAQIFIRFIENNLFKTITGITGIDSDDKYIATFCTDIIETSIEVLTNNYTNPLSIVIFEWMFRW